MGCRFCEIAKGNFRTKVYFDGFQRGESFSIVDSLVNCPENGEAHKAAICVFHFHRVPSEDEVRRMIYVSRMLFPSRRLRFESEPHHYHFHIETPVNEQDGANGKAEVVQ